MHFKLPATCRSLGEGIFASFYDAATIRLEETDSGFCIDPGITTFTYVGGLLPAITGDMTLLLLLLPAPPKEACWI